MKSKVEYVAEGEGQHTGLIHPHWNCKSISANTSLQNGKFVNCFQLNIHNWAYLKQF